jgi:hypothetical protein
MDTLIGIAPADFWVSDVCALRNPGDFIHTFAHETRSSARVVGLLSGALHY